MKKIFLIICSFFAITTPLNSYNEINQRTQIDSNYLKSDDKLAKVADGTYPSATINVNMSRTASLSMPKGSWWTSDSRTATMSYSFDSLNYSNNKKSFLKFYNKIEVNYSANWTSTGFGIDKNYNDSFSLNVQGENKNIASESKQGLVNSASWNSSVNFYWENNTLVFYFEVTSATHRSGNADGLNSTASLTINSITLKSKFDYATYYKNLTGTATNKVNALGNASKNSFNESIQYNAKQISVIGTESPSWYSKINLQQAIGEVKKRIIGSFDNNELIISYLENFNSDGATGLEITPVQPSGNASTTQPQIKTQISFYNWQTSRNEKWQFITNVDFKLSDTYWNYFCYY